MTDPLTQRARGTDARSEVAGDRGVSIHDWT